MALATCSLFLFHGSVFIALKTGGAVRNNAVSAAPGWGSRQPYWSPVSDCGPSSSFGSASTWPVFAVACAASGGCRSGAGRHSRGLGLPLHRCCRGSCGGASFALALSGNLVPSTLDSAYSLTIHNASSSHYTLTVMTWAALVCTPVVLGYQAWTYWVFRNRIWAESIPPPIGLPLRHSAEASAVAGLPAMRRCLAASIGCGVVLAFSTIGTAMALGHIVAGIVTDPSPGRSPIGGHHC